MSQKQAPKGKADPAADFVVTHAKDAEFDGGLRGFFEYRDLAMKKVTDGRIQAHVIRAKPGDAASGEWHYHVLDFQMVYVLKGWVRFEYDGVGEVLLEAGSCVNQPPGILHREIEHSQDLELLEITSPAEFETVAAKPPGR
ncbi:MAG: cupin domain-containing protein [Salinarimonas sp.]|nr:cupin domain-containing protein [Salinarimonas sp.]